VCGLVAAVAVGTRPDQIEGLAVFVGDEVRVDRCGKARIIELDREIVAFLARGLGPCGTDFDVMRCAA
jgi:hypothetical protein